MLRLTTLFMIVILTGCSNDFDQTCEFFGDLASHPKLDQMSPNDRHIYIQERMTTLGAGDARAAWDAIAYADPSEKYQLFQQVAIDSLDGDNWHCDEMKELAPIVKPESSTVMTPEVLDAMGVTTEKDADFEPKKSTLPIL